MTRRGRFDRYGTALNAHLAVVGALLLLDLVLGTKLLLAVHRGHSDQTAEYTSELATYAQLKQQAGRLQALPAQLASSRTQADQFVANRIPLNDSVMLTDLGGLTTRDRVRLSRAAYTAVPAIPGLVELRVDANVTGEYSSVMRFLNDVERDKNHAFFTIRSITLTGQQGGMVNLRTRMTTYLRADAVSAALLAQAGGANAGEDR